MSLRNSRGGSVGDLAADGVEYEVAFAVTVLASGGIENVASIDDDGSNGDDPTPDNNTSDVRVMGNPTWIPVDSPWALLLMAMALGLLAMRHRARLS